MTNIKYCQFTMTTLTHCKRPAHPAPGITASPPWLLGQWHPSPQKRVSYLKMLDTHQIKKEPSTLQDAVWRCAVLCFENTQIWKKCPKSPPLLHRLYEKKEDMLRFTYQKPCCEPWTQSGNSAQETLSILHFLIDLIKS